MNNAEIKQALEEFKCGLNAGNMLRVPCVAGHTLEYIRELERDNRELKAKAGEALSYGKYMRLDRNTWK